MRRTSPSLVCVIENMQVLHTCWNCCCEEMLAFTTLGTRSPLITRTDDSIKPLHSVKIRSLSTSREVFQYKHDPFDKRKKSCFELLHQKNFFFFFDTFCTKFQSERNYQENCRDKFYFRVFVESTEYRYWFSRLQISFMNWTQSAVRKKMRAIRFFAWKIQHLNQNVKRNMNYSHEKLWQK